MLNYVCLWHTVYMNVTFYFDPSCPFSWVTSRWLLTIQNERSITITWKPFCLAIKNNELTKKMYEAEHAQDHRDALRFLRVMLVAERDYQTPLIDMYTAGGTIRHVEGGRLGDGAIRSVLAGRTLPESLLAAADDASLDGVLRAAIDDATNAAGGDTGVPAMVFEPEEGRQQGYFGPILGALPGPEESLVIWDGLAKLATTKAFYELKRNLPAGGPDIASTTPR